MSQCPGIVLYAILTPNEGVDLEEFANTFLVEQYDDGDYELKDNVVLPDGCCIVKVRDDEPDSYQGISGDYGQVCLTYNIVNDWCGYQTVDFIKEKQELLHLVCIALSKKIPESFTYEIRVGVSFG